MTERLDRGLLLKRAGRLAFAGGVTGGIAQWAAAGARGADPRLAELASRIRGTVVGRGSAAYAKARLLYSPRFDAVRPLAVVYCESAADVRETVLWARRRGIRLAVRSGGHSYGGYSTGPGVVVDVSRIKAVSVDAARGLAAVGAGARLIDVYQALWQHKLAVPAGSCATVGIAGLVLGGGHGFSSRKLGLTCDNLRAVRIVTAAGEVLDCDASRHADLFWACRGGGGGSFGVVTRLVFRARPVANVTTYRASWNWAHAHAVIDAWQRWAPHAPDGLFAVADLIATATPGDQPFAASAGQFFGTEAQLRSILAPLLASAAPRRLTVTTTTFMEAALDWAGCSNFARCHLTGSTPGATLGRETFLAKSDYLAKLLPSQGIDTMIDWIERRQRNPMLGAGSILLDPYGGAVNRVGKAATAFVHRDQLCSFQYVAPYDPRAPAAAISANRAWIRGFHAAMRPYVSGQAYQNYADPDLVDWPQAYYGSNLARLRRIKRRYDPGNVFHFAQSIRPST